MAGLLVAERYLGEDIKFSSFTEKFMVFVRKKSSDKFEMHSFEKKEDAEQFIRERKQADEQENLAWWQK
jgi:hypothetical protein